MAEQKSRAAALKAVAGAQDPTEAPKEDVRKSFEGVEAKDFGGNVKVGVLFDAYPVHFNGAWKDAVKGQVVKVTAEVADRGESISGLVRL